MTTRLNPYLSFNGNARQAMDFYKSVFGGEMSVMTFGDGGMAQDPASKDKIMHAQLESPSGYWLMGSDNPPDQPYSPGNTITVSLSGDQEGELRSYWDKLAKGATIGMPLEKAPWGDTFGMLTDKFGIGWVVNITSPGNA
jgi:PhnB protein